jgi:hypothetical protein
MASERFELSHRLPIANSNQPWACRQLTPCRRTGKSSGYRMARVNSRGEDPPRERVFGPAQTRRDQQPHAENGGIPGPQLVAPKAESGFAQGVLAEGEELSSNPLRRLFNGLRTTQFAVNVDWRIMSLRGRYPTPLQRPAGQPLHRRYYVSPWSRPGHNRRFSMRRRMLDGPNCIHILPVRAVQAQSPS